MHIAVTGATGFLGRHVVPALLSRGARVTAMMRTASNPKPWLEGCSMAHLDMAEPRSDAFDLLGRPDCVLHMAWQGLPNYNSAHHFEVELPRQYLFLKYLLMGGLGRLLVTGTCFEYGMQPGALAETDPTRPSNPYGFAKDALRREIEFLKRNLSFSLVWARLFYTFGDGQPETSLFGQFLRAASRGEALFNMSPGDQLRDYLPAPVMGDMIARLALGHGDPGPVNVCSGKPVSVRSLVEGWIRERGVRMELNLGHFSYSDLEPLAFWGDATKIRRLLSMPDGAGRSLATIRSTEGNLP